MNINLCYTATTMSSKKQLLSDLEITIKHVDLLLEHLNKQQHFSPQDVKSLKKIIFHLDGLIIKLKNEYSDNELLSFEIVQSLTKANTHLRKLLLDKQSHPKEYQSSKKQHLSNHLFTSLIRQITKL